MGHLPVTIPAKKTGSSRSHRLLMAPQLGLWPWERSYRGWDLGWWSRAGIVRISTDAVNSWAQWPCHVQKTSVTALPFILCFCLLFCQRSFFRPFNDVFPKALHHFFTAFIFGHTCMKSSFLPIKCSFWWVVIGIWSLHVDFVLTEILIHRSA